MRIEGRNVTFTLDATILKDDPFAQLSGNINRFSFCSSFFTVNEKLILLLFAKSLGHKRHVSSLTLSCNDGEPETFNASRRKRGREREGEWREEFMARMTQMSALRHEQLRSLEDDERTNRLSPQSNFPLLSHCSSFNFRLLK